MQKKKKVPQFQQPLPILCTFSFLSCERNSRVFQETSERGGCDSLPLVVASTSKQRESPLSYALHFLRIISHQMCCAGERGLGLPGRPVEKSPRQRLIKCRGSITAVCDCEGQHICFFMFIHNPKLKSEEENTAQKIRRLRVRRQSASPRTL